MKSLRTPILSLVLLTALLSLSFIPARSAPVISPAYYPVNPVGFVNQYMMQSNRVFIKDNLLYSGYTNFTIADISNPGEAQVLDRLYTRFIYDFIVDGQYAYTAMQDLGVYNLDILVNTISEFTPVDMRSSALGLALADGRLYAANGMKGVHILDATKPADLTELGLIKAPGNSIAVAAAGKTVYIASGYDGLRIYNATDPANPVELSVVKTIGYTRFVTVENNLAYVAEGMAGMRIFDVSDPKKPVQLSLFNTPGAVRRILLRGGYAYIADGESGLTIADVSDPKAPFEASSYRYTGTVVDVALKDNLIFLANNPNGILVLSWSAPIKKEGLDQGGTLESAADSVQVRFELGALPAGARVTYQPLYRSSTPVEGDYLVKVGPFFSLSGSDGKPSEIKLAKPVKINLTYNSAAAIPGREAALGLYAWQDSGWVRAVDSRVDPQRKTLTATGNSLTIYGVFYDRRIVITPTP